MFISAHAYAKVFMFISLAQSLIVILLGVQKCASILQVYKHLSRIQCCDCLPCSCSDFVFSTAVIVFKSVMRSSISKSTCCCKYDGVVFILHSCRIKFVVSRSCCNTHSIDETGRCTKAIEQIWSFELSVLVDCNFRGTKFRAQRNTAVIKFNLFCSTTHGCCPNEDIFNVIHQSVSYQRSKHRKIWYCYLFTHHIIS